MVWIWVALVVVALVAVSALNSSSPERKPEFLDEGSIPTAEEGRAIPVIFGVRRIKDPNVVALMDIGYKHVRTKSGK